MIWWTFPLFIVAGVVVILKRRQVAWGISAFMGASANIGCAIALAIFIFLIAAGFLALHFAGILER